MPICGRVGHQGRWRITPAGTGARQRQTRIAKGAAVAAAVGEDGGATEQGRGRVTGCAAAEEGERQLQALGEEDRGASDLRAGKTEIDLGTEELLLCSYVRLGRSQERGRRLYSAQSGVGGLRRTPRHRIGPARSCFFLLFRLVFSSYFLCIFLFFFFCLFFFTFTF
jgi:hypothetical protein